MRKEVLIAIIIGFGLGLVITFGIWRANKSLKETVTSKQEISEEKAEEIITPTPVKETTGFSLTSPENNSISNKDKIAVTGKSTPEAVIVVLYQEGEKILETDKEGNFSTEITLVAGSNEIKVSSFGKDGSESTQTLYVVYSSAEI